MEKYITQYREKWMQYLIDNNIDEEDERSNTWGWQFEIDGFISTPELMLGCYLYNYSCEEEAMHCLEIIDEKDHLYDFAQKALEITR